MSGKKQISDEKAFDMVVERLRLHVPYSKLAIKYGISIQQCTMICRGLQRRDILQRAHETLAKLDAATTEPA